MIKGDVNDSAIVREAVRGCDYILHCAYGNKGSAESRNKVNVEGTLNLLHAAKEEGVSALVFLSTVSVYELTDKAQLNELSLVNPHKEDEYAISKLEAEKQVMILLQKTISTPRYYICLELIMNG